MEGPPISNDEGVYLDIKQDNERPGSNETADPHIAGHQRTNDNANPQIGGHQRRNVAIVVGVIFSFILLIGLGIAGYYVHGVTAKSVLKDPDVTKQTTVDTMVDVRPGSGTVTCSKPVFINTPQQTINSASAVSGQADLQTCLRICAADSTCVSIVLRNRNQCSIVRNGLESSVFDAHAELWRYQKTCRNSNKVCDFDYQGKYYVTNAAVSRQATLGNCVAACMAETDCDAFSYNDATDYCRVVTSAAELGSRFSLAGYIMYRPLSCDAVSQQTTTAPPAPIPFTSPPFPPPGTCGNSYFMRYDNQYVAGGSLVATTTTQQACENRCLHDIDCVGYDFDAFGQSWLVSNGLTEREAQAESDHYRSQKELLQQQGRHNLQV